MSMTPPLLSMLDNKLLQQKYIHYLEKLIELSEKEIEKIVESIKESNNSTYSEDILESIEKAGNNNSKGGKKRYEFLADHTGFVLKGKNNPDYYYTKSKVDPLYLQAEGHAVITQWYQMKNRIVEIIS